MIDTSTDPLARFLPAHCDARLISHYLALLADNEARLKHQLSKAHKELQQSRQGADKAAVQESRAIPSTKVAPVSQPDPPPAQTDQSFHFVNSAHRSIAASKAYQNGINYYKKYQLDKAITSFREACEAGHPEAENMLGECYYYNSQLTESLRWYERAAEKGDANAIYSLGYMHYFGEGTKADSRKAYNFLKRAEAAGSADARDLLIKLSSR